MMITAWLPLVPLLSLPALPALAAPLEITSDTVWEGAIEVKDAVHVSKEATLLIQPGTVVRFGGVANGSEPPKAGLFVNGVLVAQGTAAQPIVFTSAGSEPHPGDWAGIVLEHANTATNRIRHARIEYAAAGITGGYSKLLAENLTLRNNQTGIVALTELNGWMFDSTVTGNTLGVHYNQSSAFQIEGCEISGNISGGIGCTMGSSPAVRRSTIAGNGERGIACIQGSSPLLEGNVIRGHRRGVHAELQSRPEIIRNTIAGNETGIWAEKYAFARILGNTIRDNEVGIYCNFASYPEIRGNNLDGNRRFAIVVGDNMSIKVEKLIPSRVGGVALEAAPAGREILPPQTRKFSPFAASEEGLVDARGNWWGEKVTAEMDRLGEGGNISAIEDFHDKPEVFYRDAPFPRDRVRFSPWEREAVSDTAPPPSPFAKVTGTVVAEGKPVAGVRVHVYRDDGGSLLGAGFSYSGPTAADGGFLLNLPAGAYSLVVKGPSPPFPGAEPGAGAFFGLYPGNPVTIAPGSSASFTIEAARRAPAATAPGSP